MESIQTEKSFTGIEKASDPGGNRGGSEIKANS